MFEHVDTISKSTSVLTFSSVCKSYRSEAQSLLILDSIDFTVERGSAVAITGKSGSGKSTLLHIAGAMDKPDSGSVIFNGNDLGSLSDADLSVFRNRNIGYVFQSHVLLADFNTWENVCIPAFIKGVQSCQAKKRAMELLDRVGLSDRANHHPGKLSGGERQRVALCRALMNNPDIIIADEPTGSLDEESSLHVEHLLLTLVKEEQKTMLLVTHDLQLAKHCDIVYLLHNRNVQRIQ